MGKLLIEWYSDTGYSLILPNGVCGESEGFPVLYKFRGNFNASYLFLHLFFVGSLSVEWSSNPRCPCSVPFKLLGKSGSESLMCCDDQCDIYEFKFDHFFNGTDMCVYV